jgi:hypothetical protein
MQSIDTYGQGAVTYRWWFPIERAYGYEGPTRPNHMQKYS